jgi:glycerol-3-phosphate acyltransferase PlsY
VDDVPLVVTIVSVVGAYLLGTVPTAQVVAARRGIDPTADGSGNPGASNVYRLAGRRAGIAVLLIDMAKGAVPALVGLLLGGRALGVACAAAAVLGHIAPATRGWRGGKGVATASGAAIVLWPLPSVVLAVVFLVAARVIGIASVGSLLIAAGLPVLVALFGGPGWEVAAAAGISILVVARHRDNIRRLGSGDERRIRPSPIVPPPTE